MNKKKKFIFTASNLYKKTYIVYVASFVSFNSQIYFFEQI